MIKLLKSDTNYDLIFLSRLGLLFHFNGLHTLYYFFSSIKNVTLFVTISLFKVRDPRKSGIWGKQLFCKKYKIDTNSGLKKNYNISYELLRSSCIHRRIKEF